ncbi:MAG: hypothetical protein ABW148_18690 [Sedimenticola sp.]
MVYITYKNKVQYLAQWAEEYKIPYQCFRYRISVNWSMKKALTTLPGALGNGKVRYIKYKGKTKSVKELSKEYGIAPYNIKARIRAGWTVHKTLTTPERAFHKIVKYKGKKRSVKEWSRLYNVSYKVLAKRLWNGWTMEEALTIPVRGYKFKNE